MSFGLFFLNEGGSKIVILTLSFEGEESSASINSINQKNWIPHFVRNDIVYKFLNPP